MNDFSAKGMEKCVVHKSFNYNKGLNSLVTRPPANLSNWIHYDDNISFAYDLMTAKENGRKLRSMTSLVAPAKKHQRVCNFKNNLLHTILQRLFWSWQTPQCLKNKNVVKKRKNITPILMYH